MQQCQFVDIYTAGGAVCTALWWGWGSVVSHRHYLLQVIAQL